MEINKFYIGYIIGILNFLLFMVVALYLNQYNSFEDKKIYENNELEYIKSLNEIKFNYSKELYICNNNLKYMKALREIELNYTKKLYSCYNDLEKLKTIMKMFG